MSRSYEQIDAGLRARFDDAAGQLGGSDAARRRVVEPRGRRSLRPLAVALSSAVIAAAAGGVVAWHAHQAPGGTAHPTPSAAPSPSPSARPLPGAFAPFFKADDLTLGAPLAFGHLALTGDDNTLAIGGYRLSVGKDPGSPATAPVWRLDHSSPPGLPTLQDHFTANATPQPDSRGVVSPGSASWDPDNAMLLYSSGTMGQGGLSLDATPRDAADAARLANLFMTRRGLLFDNASAPHGYAYDQSSSPQPFSVSWQRVLDGHAVYDRGGRASLGIGPDGTISDILVTDIPVAGGSPYPIIPWRQAWNQVIAGRWYWDLGGFTGGNGQSSMPVFDATSVELGYIGVEKEPGHYSATEQADLVPMWVFTSGEGIQLFYPAVAPSSLSYTHVVVPFGSPRS